jgi:ATP-dependent Lhr-like helicase
VWVGLEPLGERDGRIAFYLTDHLRRLLPPSAPPTLEGRQHDLVQHLRRSGASFFVPLHDAIGGGFPKETLDALWSLVWQGQVTSDTLHALRAYVCPPARARRAGRLTPFRSRRLIPPAAEGRWDIIRHRISLPRESRGTRSDSRSATHWSAAMAEQLLVRHGLVTREVASVEQLPGGFAAIYPALSRLEDTGRVRRGYFVTGLGAAQFAQPGAVDLLRAQRDEQSPDEAITLAATDPANPYGALVPWPAWPSATTEAASDPVPASGATGPLRSADGARRAGASRSTETVRRPGASRSAGAQVIIVSGRLAAWIARGDRQMFIDLPPDEPDRSRQGRVLASALIALAAEASGGRQGWLIEEINGRFAELDPAAAYLLDAGFRATSRGLQLRIARDGRRE